MKVHDSDQGGQFLPLLSRCLMHRAQPGMPLALPSIPSQWGFWWAMKLAMPAWECWQRELGSRSPMWQLPPVGKLFNQENEENLSHRVLENLSPEIWGFYMITGRWLRRRKEAKKEQSKTTGKGPLRSRVWWTGSWGWREYGRQDVCACPCGGSWASHYHQALRALHSSLWDGPCPEQPPEDSLPNTSIRGTIPKWFRDCWGHQPDPFGGILCKQPAHWPLEAPCNWTLCLCTSKTAQEKSQHTQIRIHFANNYYIKQDGKHAFLLSIGKFYLLRVSSLEKKICMSYHFCWIQGSLVDPQSRLGCSNEDQSGPPHSFFKIASLVAMHYPGCYSLSGRFFDLGVSAFIAVCSLPWNNHLIVWLQLLFPSSGLQVTAAFNPCSALLPPGQVALKHKQSI